MPIERQSLDEGIPPFRQKEGDSSAKTSAWMQKPMTFYDQASFQKDLSRRSLLRAASALAATSILSHGVKTASATEKEGMDSARWTRVKSVVELQGEVRLKDERSVMKGATKSAPVESTSTLDYEEHSLACNEGYNGAFAYRNIFEAKTDCRINKQPIRIELRPICNNLIQWMDGPNLWINSPDQPLTPNERDLVRGTVASAFVDELLPKTAIRVGDSWDLSNESARRIFQLDSVLNSTVKVTLVDADQEKAQLELSGKIEGVAGDVATELNLRGKIQADRKRAIVTWIAMNINENREISESKPGFRVEARLRLLRSPIEAPKATETLATASAGFGSVDMVKILRFSSSHGGFAFLAESDWNILQDNPDQMVLRLVKNNTTIAQCNIKRMQNLEAGRQVTLEGYQDLVARSLSESFKQFVEGGESISDSKLRLVRTVAVGETQGVPIQWVNCLLSDDSGRRVTMTFTMDQSMAEKFANTDVPLVGGFQFEEQVVPTSPNGVAPKVGNAIAPTKR